MPHVIQLEVLAERPVNSTIVLRRDGTPYEAGRPSLFQFTCGGCARVLATAADSSRLSSLVLVCPVCESLNSVSDSPAPSPASGPLASSPPGWSPALLTGHPTIDEQHRQIFERVDGLHRAMRVADWAVAARTMDFLGGYVIDHFSMEEVQMRARGFPSYEAHLAQHSQFVRSYLDLKQEVAARVPNAALTAKTRAWLVDWLRWHIMGADVALAAFLRSTG